MLVGMSGTLVGIVIDGGTIQLQPCGLYAHHVPILNDHHVVPESWWRAAGVPVASPMMLLCPNCHTATHAAIDGLLAGHGVGLLPPRCVALARQGIEQARTAGLTPAPTL